MSSSTAEPNYAQILLPPGFTLEGYFELQREIVTISIATSCALAIAAWDYFNLLPMELALYRGMERRMWTTPATWAFLTLRYSAFLALLSGLWFTVLPNMHCQVAASISQTGVVLVTGSSGIVFSYRVFSIWKFNKLVCGVVGSLYLIMVGCWIAVATQLGATEGPLAQIGSNCVIDPVPVWSPIGFASSVAFDTVVLILTISGLHGAQRKSHIGRLLLNDNILYFIIVTITNLIVLIIQSLETTNLIKPVVLPYPTVMTTAMGSRVFLNLRLFGHGRSSGDTSIPLSSTSIPRATVQFPTHHGYYPNYEIDDRKNVNTHVRINRTTEVLGSRMDPKIV